MCVGENGEAVYIEKEKLSPENRTKFDNGWQNNAFNQFASDMISLHRSLPDIRDEGYTVVMPSLLLISTYFHFISYCSNHLLCNILLYHYQKC